MSCIPLKTRDVENPPSAYIYILLYIDSAMKGSTAITSEEISSLHESLLTQIKEGKQSGLYLYLCEKFGATYKEWQEDKVLSKELGVSILSILSLSLSLPLYPILILSLFYPTYPSYLSYPYPTHI